MALSRGSQSVHAPLGRSRRAGSAESRAPPLPPPAGGLGGAAPRTAAPGRRPPARPGPAAPRPSRGGGGEGEPRCQERRGAGPARLGSAGSAGAAPPPRSRSPSPPRAPLGRCSASGPRGRPPRSAALTGRPAASRSQRPAAARRCLAGPPAGTCLPCPPRLAPSLPRGGAPPPPPPRPAPAARLQTPAAFTGARRRGGAGRGGAEASGTRSPAGRRSWAWGEVGADRCGRVQEEPRSPAALQPCRLRPARALLREHRGSERSTAADRISKAGVTPSGTSASAKNPGNQETNQRCHFSRG